MKSLSVSKTKTLDKIDAGFDCLVGAHNGNIKRIFLGILKNGEPPELIGEYFQHSLEQIERKDKGQYYTPKVIVEYMISQLDVEKGSRILDPACGCASFLLAVFDLFKDKFGLTVLNNIFGVDINEDAVKMTRLCLYMKSGFNDNYIDVIKNNIKVGNSTVSKKEIDRDAFDWYSRFNNIMQEGGFDFIIGNPPYVTLSKYKDFDPSESIYSEIIDGPVNAATLMIGRSLELLRENGVLAFLLPKSILYVDSYAKLRRYIVKNTVLLQIFDVGSKFKDVRGEQIILIIKKKKPTFKTKVKICTFKYKDRKLSKQPFVMIPQTKFADLDRFLTFEDNRYYKLIEKVSKIGIRLKEFVDGKIFRGLPIGGNYTQTENSNLMGIEVIRGKDITKFTIKPLSILDKRLLNEQSKTKINNLKNKKVVLQNIFSSESGVIAAYDNKKLLTLDTVTNVLVPKDEKGKYILALLTSKLINFYLMYGIFNRARLTMHMDKSYVGFVPVVEKPDKTKLNRLIKIVDSLAREKDLRLQKEKNRKIDALVYDIYSLNGKEIKLIEKAASNMLSRKSLW